MKRPIANDRQQRDAPKHHGDVGVIRLRRCRGASAAGSPIVLVVGNVVGEMVGPLTGNEVGVGLRLRDGK